jgi:hypothetical protein
MSTPNPVLVAAAPSINAALVAISTFITNLGPDPTKVAVTFPGALQVLLGQLELQLPVLANSEFGAVQTAAQSKIAQWQASLATAVSTPAPAPAAS